MAKAIPGKIDFSKMKGFKRIGPEEKIKTDEFLESSKEIVRVFGEFFFCFKLM